MSFLVFVFKWLLVLAVLGATAYAAIELPKPRMERQGSILAAIPEDLPAIEAQRKAFNEFGVPLLTRTVVVSSYNGEKSALEQAELTGRILSLADTFAERDPAFIAGIPVPEAVWPRANGGQEESVVLTYLILDPRQPVSRQLRIAQQFSDEVGRETGSEYTAVTGALQASEDQARIVDSHVHWIEGATLLLVFLILALRFRSFVAPAVTLVAGGVAYIAAMALLAAVQDRLDLTFSSVVQPLLIVLIFGIVTDYAIFYLGSFRQALIHPEGEHTSSGSALWSTWRSVTPIVAVAATIVLLGGLALFVAELELVRSLAPAIAFAVLLSFLISTTFTPLLISCLGRSVFWPSEVGEEDRPGGWAVIERQLTKRWVAVPALLILGAGLVLAASKAGDVRLATNLIEDLPGNIPAARAEEIAAASIPRGAIAPTVLVLNGAGVAEEDAGLAKLESQIRESRGVATVVGPSIDPGLVDVGVFKAPTGNAARLLIVFDSDPYGSEAIDDFRLLAKNLPGFLTEAGLHNTEASFAGDTAISSQVSGIALEDVLKVGALIFVLETALLFVYLRSLIVPPLLLAITLLLVLASLGLTVSISSYVLGQDGVNFLVPVATVVLLLSLGADYNLFLIGKVWSAKRSLPFSRALQDAAAESSSTILTAGLALTASFAILAVVPLVSFRQIALAISIGLLADTLVIRPFLVPAMLATLERVSTWPGSSTESVSTERRTLRDAAVDRSEPPLRPP